MAIELNHQPGQPVAHSGGFPRGIWGAGAPHAGESGVVPPGQRSTPVTLANRVTLDYDHSDVVERHHYAFAVSDEEFEAAFGRIRDAGITYYADPGCTRAGEVYHGKAGNRGTYFRDPNGHLMEILTPVSGEHA